ncbi:hypothetical protein FocTR4_00017014 [Fusarium oxysporum f. sp. cubense]|uniref:Uncharacterized protein n=2 Tax=Fusarium oxysporum f. sp. cubense TaxID=61366 RepID=N4UB55_FUSC1|nr:hypothetical protein FOC1_g10001944 [Fusarium oxysporum f. sp. cubense race 1]TXB97923.1 hypothetical protein FocTR4_00017014 [Fusarium oxysporum f. sp. cubense]
MREGAGIDALFKLAFYADLIVLPDSVSSRSQVIDQSREGIKSLQYVIGLVEDAEKIALKAEIPPLLPLSALSACQLYDRGILSREAGRIDARNSFPTPVPWLRRLGFIHIAFDRMVNHAKAVITPDIIYWYALFEANRKELDKDRVMLGRR